MPTHNRADVVGYAIASVLQQTESDFELLVVGDGCTDDTAQVVAGFGDERIRWYDLPKAPHFGYANRNVALRDAAGELVAFAAHDDLLFPDHLELLSSAIDETGADWLYSRPLWVSTDGVIVPYCTNLTNADELDDFLNVCNTIPASCVLHRRSCFERSGYWPEDVSVAADWQFWIRIINDASKIHYLPTPTTLHFSATWRKSRHSSASEVETMLATADAAPWWPSSLSHNVGADQTEQGVIFAAMSATGGDWSTLARQDIERVIDRLAWDAIRSPQAPDLAELARATQLAEASVAEIRRLKDLRAAEHHEAQAQIATLRAELDSVYRSRTWRLAEPLRRARAKLSGEPL